MNGLWLLSRDSGRVEWLGHHMACQSKIFIVWSFRGKAAYFPCKDGATALDEVVNAELGL